jgi:hypothetical protein
MDRSTLMDAVRKLNRTQLRELVTAIKTRFVVIPSNMPAVDTSLDESTLGTVAVVRVHSSASVCFQASGSGLPTREPTLTLDVVGDGSWVDPWTAATKDEDLERTGFPLPLPCTVHVENSFTDVQCQGLMMFNNNILPGWSNAFSIGLKDVERRFTTMHVVGRGRVRVWSDGPAEALGRMKDAGLDPSTHPPHVVRTLPPDEEYQNLVLQWTAAHGVGGRLAIAAVSMGSLTPPYHRLDKVVRELMPECKPVVIVLDAADRVVATSAPITCPILVHDWTHLRTHERSKEDGRMMAVVFHPDDKVE